MPQSVLIVEDDPDAREMLQTLFDLAGLQARSAATAREGIALARELRPCVILLDLNLPDVDGSAFRRQQQRDPVVAGIPVIVVSAHPSAKAIAQDLGAADCLGKPVDFDALLARVHHLCGSSKHATSSFS